MGQNFSAEKEDYACRGRVKNIIIFTLVIVIIFLSKCVGDNEVIVSEPITIIETETLLDTIETVTTKTLWKTNTHFIYDTVIINVPIKPIETPRKRLIPARSFKNNTARIVIINGFIAIIAADLANPTR